MPGYEEVENLTFQVMSGEKVKKTISDWQYKVSMVMMVSSSVLIVPLFIALF